MSTLHVTTVAVTTVTLQLTVFQDVVSCNSAKMCSFLLHCRIRKQHLPSIRPYHLRNYVESHYGRKVSSYRPEINKRLKKKNYKVTVFSQVTWPSTHSLTQSNSDQCNIHTLTRVSPTNFDTIHFVCKILLLRYLTRCFSLQT
jgi:hypothetical protein